MQLSSNQSARKTLFPFPFNELPLDVQRHVLAHTATSFTVQSDSTMCFRFPEVSWYNVPYVICYEFKLLPRNFDTQAEMEVRVSRFLKPEFKHSRLFSEVDVSMQEMLVNNFKEITFSSVSAARLELRNRSLQFIQFISRTHGEEHVYVTPYWSHIERNVIQQVRERLKSMFHMEFDDK
jgi:hypothetical protein